MKIIHNKSYLQATKGFSFHTDVHVDQSIN